MKSERNVDACPARGVNVVHSHLLLKGKLPAPSTRRLSLLHGHFLLTLKGPFFRNLYKSQCLKCYYDMKKK